MGVPISSVARWPTRGRPLQEWEVAEEVAWLYAALFPRSARNSVLSGTDGREAVKPESALRISNLTSRPSASISTYTVLESSSVSAISVSENFRYSAFTLGA
jgi:hypothetical protein